MREGRLRPPPFSRPTGRIKGADLLAIIPLISKTRHLARISLKKIHIQTSDILHTFFYMILQVKFILAILPNTVTLIVFSVIIIIIENSNYSISFCMGLLPPPRGVRIYVMSPPSPTWEGGGPYAFSPSSGRAAIPYTPQTCLHKLL